MRGPPPRVHVGCADDLNGCLKRIRDQLDHVREGTDTSIGGVVRFPRRSVLSDDPKGARQIFDADPMSDGGPVPRHDNAVVAIDAIGNDGSSMREIKLARSVLEEPAAVEGSSVEVEVTFPVTTRGKMNTEVLIGKFDNWNEVAFDVNEVFDAPRPIASRGRSSGSKGGRIQAIAQ